MKPGGKSLQSLYLYADIKKHRIKRGWSCQYVGEQVGVTRQCVNKYERGVLLPSSVVLYKLAALFSIQNPSVLIKHKSNKEGGNN